MSLLSSLIAENANDKISKLVNLGLVKEMIGSGKSLEGTSYLFVKGNGTPTGNAAEFQTALDAVKTMPRYLGSDASFPTIMAYKKGQTYYCSSLNNYRVMNDDYIGNVEEAKVFSSVISGSVAKAVKTSIIIAPGFYDSGDTPFVIDTPSVNIVSLTGKRDVILSPSVIIGSDVAIMTSTDGLDFNGAVISGLNVLGSIATLTSSTETVKIKNLIFNNCKGSSQSFFSAGNNHKISTTGCFCMYCEAPHSSFGYSAEKDTATYIRCKGAESCFGKTDAGGYYSFCEGGTASWAGMGGQFTGTAEYCIGDNYSFATIKSTARLYSCRLKSGTFPTPEEGGKLFLCIDSSGVVTTPTT